MIARDASVLGLEKKLYPLYYEIRVLKRRVEDQTSTGSGECCQEIRALLEQYSSVEAMIQELKTSNDRDFKKNLSVVEQQVDELAQWVSAQSPWIMMRVADQYSLAYG